MGRRGPRSPPGSNGHDALVCATHDQWGYSGTPRCERSPPGALCLHHRPSEVTTTSRDQPPNRGGERVEHAPREVSKTAMQ
jgi:hypothetical protein